MDQHRIQQKEPVSLVWETGSDLLFLSRLGESNP